MPDPSSPAIDVALQSDLASLAPPRLLIGHRVITAGDERALRDAEAASIASSVEARRRASGAARIVARALLAQLGHPDVSVPRGSAGEPVWPAGVTGSLAHDERIAIAALGLQRDFGAVGIDIESAVPLAPDMLELVALPAERPEIMHDPLAGKLLFAAKEAVYKAVYPLDRLFLEFHDIEVDLANCKAVTRGGRVLALRTCISSHVVALALA